MNKGGAFPVIVVITCNCCRRKLRIKRRTVSPGMARVAQKLVEEFGIPVDRAGDPEFYLIDRLTGRPLIPRNPRRRP